MEIKIDHTVFKTGDLVEVLLPKNKEGTYYRISYWIYESTVACCYYEWIKTKHKKAWIWVGYDIWSGDMTKLLQRHR